MPFPHRAARRLGLALALLASPLGAQSIERHVLRGTDVAIYDPAGRVDVVAGSGTDVVVEVTRRGRDAARLRIMDDAVDGRPALRVIAPERDLVFPELGASSSTTLRVRPNGTFNDGGDSDRGDELTIRGSGRGPEAWADVVVRVPARARVAVHIAAGTATARDVESDLTIGAGAANVSTERTRGRLTVGSGSGRASVHDAQGSEIRIGSGSGTAELRGVRAERLDVGSGSGDVSGGEVDAREVRFGAGSGSIRLAIVRAHTVRAGVGSGTVELDLAGDLDEARVGSGSGNVTLRLPRTLGATLNVTTGSGGITTDIPIQVTRQEARRLTGTIGDGRARISVSTGSGEVRLAAAR